jgi:hypothetical protein
LEVCGFRIFFGECEYKIIGNLPWIQNYWKFPLNTKLFRISSEYEIVQNFHCIQNFWKFPLNTKLFRIPSEYKIFQNAWQKNPIVKLPKTNSQIFHIFAINQDFFKKIQVRKLLSKFSMFFQPL